MKNFVKNFRNAVYLVVLAGISPIALAGAYEDFFTAVETDNGAQIQALLRRGFDANSRDAKGQTGLYLALKANAYSAAEVLLKAPGVDVNALNAAGESALMMAALKGQADWSRRLIDQGAKVDQTGWSPLHYAATGPEPAVVKLLLDRGAAIDAPSPNGTTALMMAAQYGVEASVELLLARGADPRVRNEKGLSAADFARLARRDALASRLERAFR
jgi:ankyrin repeat protein